MNSDALAAALASLERSRTPTVMHSSPAPSLSRSSTPGAPAVASPAMYYTTPSIPMKWRTGELHLDEDSMPLNLGVEKVADDEEQHWSALGFRLPRRTVPSVHVARGAGEKSPRRFGIDVDWDCGICLEPASDPCVTRCGHLFCERDLRMWFRSKPTDPRCPVCKTTCSPENDVVPIFGRGKTAPAQPAGLSVVGPARLRRFASRTPSMEVIPAGGTEESDSAGSSVDPPSLTASPPSSFSGTPVPSGLATPVVDADADTVLGLLYPHAHPLVKHDVISHHLGRLLSLLGFVALMIFLLK
ncbi:hypothetical protein AURDEDRAFT_111805 [Auricularia subglabra TFB-10046 SS5]|nr:hypothetical protein AURDEDRAFT_111805 [Auricularia subglabra TFB-10046 SS5]